MGATRAGTSDGAEQVGACTGKDYLRGRERTENFPVALRLLPRRHRRHLSALYDVARTIDDLGDQAAGDRVAQLSAFRADLATIWAGQLPRHPVLRRLAPTVAACDLPEQPFQALVEANLRDQAVTSYRSWDDLLEYCSLSADPVGRLVLAVFGATSPDNELLSDRICTALQVIEHCQDLGEDRRAGRVYLPAEDLDRFGVGPADLDAGQSSRALRELVAWQAQRCAGLLRAGQPLLRRLPGWGRLAVTGYLAGGWAALDALRRGGWSVLPAAPPVRRSDVLRHVLWLGVAG